MSALKRTFGGTILFYMLSNYCPYLADSNVRYSTSIVQPSEQLPCTGFEGCGWSRTSTGGFGVGFSLATSQNLARSGSGYA